MEYGDGYTKLDSYKDIVRQIVRLLPDWLSELTDHLGKDYNPRGQAIEYLRGLARKDLGLNLEDLLELKKFAEREVYDESDNQQRRFGTHISL
ncbi:MAG: hypothetical protein ACXACW_11310 [Candidatus Hodarchaeales archaeon]|jgi:hypothetical protein